MNTLASKNPDEKIKATAALDNSQKRALNLDSDLTYDANTNVNETTPDLKFCSVYGYRGTTVKPVSITAGLIPSQPKLIVIFHDQPLNNGHF